MKIPFACPVCGLVGSLDAAHAGKSIRCKQCGSRSRVPEIGEPEAETYALDEPTAGPAREVAAAPVHGSTFVVAPRNEPMRPPRPRRATGKASPARARKRKVDFAWLKWLIGFAAAAVLALVAISLFVPRGTLIAGCIVLVIGSGMLLMGYLVGAYAAFCEDFLYGFLYLVIPLYTAYYLITRWDDLWVWCACSTAGVGLIVLGTEIARWAGVWA
jgi:hypothetical protein